MEIKNDLFLVGMCVSGLKDKSKDIILDRNVYDEMVSDVSCDVDCSNAYKDGITSGETMKDALDNMCKLIVETGTALAEADKEAERNNSSNK